MLSQKPIQVPDTLLTPTRIMNLAASLSNLFEFLTRKPSYTGDHHVIINSLLERKAIPDSIIVGGSVELREMLACL